MCLKSIPGAVQICILFSEYNPVLINSVQLAWESTHWYFYKVCLFGILSLKTSESRILLRKTVQREREREKGNACLSIFVFNLPIF
jgi:hypothetical protein